MDSLQVTVVQQQFLERIDSREREKNIVITGIPEDETLNGAQSGKEKCDEVFKVIGFEVETDVCRLGEKRTGKMRPVLAKTPSKSARDLILSKSKILKEADTKYKKIYVKKDIHPAVRNEWKRLKDAELEEKKEANQPGM